MVTCLCILYCDYYVYISLHLHLMIRLVSCVALGIPNPVLQVNKTPVFYYTSTIAWLERGLQVLQHEGDLMLLVST